MAAGQESIDEDIPGTNPEEVKQESAVSITALMVEAGVYALQFAASYPPDYLVKLIYRSMQASSHSPERTQPESGALG